MLLFASSPFQFVFKHIFIIEVKRSHSNAWLMHLHTVAAFADELHLLYRNDTTTIFFFALDKKKDSTKVFFAFSNAQLKNSGFDLTGNIYFVVNDTTIFLPGDSDRRKRVAERSRATQF